MRFHNHINLLRKKSIMNKLIHVGLDIGSTTVKVVILNKDKEVIFSDYTRHFSDTKNTLYNVLIDLIKMYHM